MNCEQCGGECYDNRQKVNNGWKGPLFKCKDKDGCGWVKWPPKGQQRGNGNGGKPNGAPSPRAAGRPLAPLYNECLSLAVRIVPKQLKDATPADILAAAATLFIAASRDGAPLMPTKPKPAPPPPPPEPEPEPEEEYADGLPF